MDQEILKNLNDPMVMAGIAVIALIVFVFWVMRRRSTSGKRRVLKVIKKITGEYIDNIIIPDGIGGLIEIDYLLLVPNGVILLDIKDFKGVLFGAENTDLWSQVLGVKSYKFNNPIPQHKQRLLALKAFFPGISISGRIVFTNEGRFPKGKPDSVSMLNELGEDVLPLTGSGEASPELKTAWERFKKTVNESEFNL